MSEEKAWSFEKTWHYQQGALFLKEENSSLEWKKNLAEYFFRHGTVKGQELGIEQMQQELTAANARIAELQGQLDEQDEINMNQINKIADLEIKLSKSIEYCSKHLDLMWAASIVSILLDCDFREARDVVGKWRLENERSKTSPCGD